MTEEETATIVLGIRQAMEEVLLPELREIRADLAAMRQRLDNVGTEITHWLTPIDKRFERIERQVNVYQDVQLLKKQVAELRARQRPSA